MTNEQRAAMQSAIRSAARKAARNPGPDEGDLVKVLTDAGMAFLAEQDERLIGELDDPAMTTRIVARDLWWRAVRHLLDVRRAARAAAAALPATPTRTS